MTDCWAVVYDGYYPMEVDTLWSTRDLAEKRAEKLNDDDDGLPWRVKHMAILSDPSELKEA